MTSPYQIVSRSERVQPHDIDLFMAAYHPIPAVGGGLNEDVTAAITTAAATGGSNGTALSLTPSSNINNPGWMSNTGLNNPMNGSDGVPPQVDGREVFAQLAVAGAVYTATYFTLNAAGAEINVNLPAGNYTIMAAYRHSLETLPTDANIRATQFRVIDDASVTAIIRPEYLTIATLNTIPALTTPVPTGGMAILWKGNRAFFSNDPTPIFTAAGATLTYNPINAGTDLFPGEVIGVQVSN